MSAANVEAVFSSGTKRAYRIRPSASSIATTKSCIGSCGSQPWREASRCTIIPHSGRRSRRRRYWPRPRTPGHEPGRLQGQLLVHVYEISRPCTGGPAAPEVLHGEVRVALALERAHLLDGRQRDARAPRLATAVVDQPVIPVALPALLQPPQVSGRDPQDVCCLNPRQLPGDRLHDHFLPAHRLYLSGHPSLDALHRRLCSRQRPTSLSAYTPGHLQCSLQARVSGLTLA